MDPVPPALRKPARGFAAHAQVKPECPHPPPERVLPPPWEPAMTFTAVKARSTLVEPQAVHTRPSPAAYADMERRTAKAAPQSWQMNS